MMKWRWSGVVGIGERMRASKRKRLGMARSSSLLPGMGRLEALEGWRAGVWGCGTLKNEFRAPPVPDWRRESGA